MRAIKITLLIALLSFSFISFANPEAEVEASKLLKTMDMNRIINENMSNMVDMQIQQQPTLAPFKSVIMKFFQKHMSWESLEFEFIYIYSHAFTAQELRELRAFYETQTGKKALEKMPQLSAQGSLLGALRVKENMPEMQAMLIEEAERLRLLSEQQK